MLPVLHKDQRPTLRVMDFPAMHADKRTASKPVLFAVIILCDVLKVADEIFLGSHSVGLGEDADCAQLLRVCATDDCPCVESCCVLDKAEAGWPKN